MKVNLDSYSIIFFDNPEFVICCIKPVEYKLEGEFTALTNSVPSHTLVSNEDRIGFLTKIGVDVFLFPELKLFLKH